MAKNKVAVNYYTTFGSTGTVADTIESTRCEDSIVMNYCGTVTC